MPLSVRQFHVGLYREHLEEASFLYEQRLAYLHDPEVNWPDVRDLEERFEAHIDGLVLGGDVSLEVCRQKAADCDAGELHAALRVLCRRDQKDDAFAVLSAIDPENQEAIRAASQAIRCDAPGAWRDDLLRLLQRDEAQLTHALAQVVGYRRFGCEKFLARALNTTPSRGDADIAWALGRVGTTWSIPVLRRLLESGDDNVCEAAGIGLMRLGDDMAVHHAMECASRERWARRVLAIGGGPRAVSLLVSALGTQTADQDLVVALGLLGDLSVVAPLLDLLDDESLAVAAAVALNTITGAQLFASIFVPDEVDPDELTNDERETFDGDGTLPDRKGRPLGNWERRPLLDRARWHAWLGENRHRFHRGPRWRMGQPYGPAALLECLRSETSPYTMRGATYEELVVRFGLDVPFEIDLPVSQQWRFLEKIEGWVARESRAFEDGHWYFAGRRQG